MSKIIKNTTLSDIELVKIGLTIPASGQAVLDTRDFLLLAEESSVTELETLINSGDIVINDGVNDLSTEDAVNFIRYSDFAENVRVYNEAFLAVQSKEAIFESKFKNEAFNLIDGGEFKTDRIFFGYNEVGSQTITGSFTTISIDTQSSDSDQTGYLLSNGEVEFRYSDKVNVIYSVTFDTPDGTRSNTESILEINRGSGFVEVVGSNVFTYERTSNADRQTGSTSVPLLISSGDIIRVRSRVIQGSNNASTAEGCRVTIIPSTTKTESVLLSLDGSDLSNTEITNQYDAGEL